LDEPKCWKYENGIHKYGGQRIDVQA